MLKQQSKIVTNISRAADILLTVLSFVCVYYLKQNLLPEGLKGLAQDPKYHIILLMIVIIWHLSFSWFGLYSSQRNKSQIEILSDVFKSVVVAMLILIVTLYFFKIENVSRILMGSFFVLNLSTMILSRTVVYGHLKKVRAKGKNTRNIIVLGSKTRAREIIQAIVDQPDTGLRIIGVLETNPQKVGTKIDHNVSVLDTIDNLETVLTHTVIDEVIFAMPLSKIPFVDQYISMAEEMGMSVRIIPDWQLHCLTYKPGVATIRFEEYLGTPTMALHTTPPNETALFLKKIMDYTLSAGFIVLSLPLFILICAAIKCSSKGPVFFKQKRVGKNGRPFYLYKFRTMVANAEKQFDKLKEMNESDGPVFKIKNDPRIIPMVGTFLRSTSLDELPQLINVIRGEMSLVGPRPPVPWEVEEYDVWQRRRLSMMPGLTCLWQIAPSRNDIGFHDWMKMDLKYIDNWSLGLDFKILLGTAKAVILKNGR